jgi:hypothetical protein
MYFGLRQIATLPTRRDPEPNRKKKKKQAKVCKLHTDRPAVKSKARTSPGKIFDLALFFRGKNFTGSLAFFPHLHVGGAFFFSGFFFVEMVSLNRLDQGDCPFAR